MVLLVMTVVSIRDDVPNIATEPILLLDILQWASLSLGLEPLMKKALLGCIMIGELTVSSASPVEF